MDDSLAIGTEVVPVGPQLPPIPEDLRPGYLYVRDELGRMALSLRVPRDAESEPAQVFNLQMLLR